jgi:hypothetical protein
MPDWRASQNVIGGNATALSLCPACGDADISIGAQRDAITTKREHGFEFGQALALVEIPDLNCVLDECSR